jgi:histidinol phosphatase-like PHP family hydrolase
MTLDNAAIAELLAAQAEKASDTLRRAYKRAARAAFLWPIESSDLLKQGQPLTELPAIGPYLEKQVRSWLENPPKEPIQPPGIRRTFLTLAKARKALHAAPDWPKRYRGDLQMHSKWSDGAGSIEDMVYAAQQRGYEYIAITDHSQGLRIAGGISEQELQEQVQEIDAINTEWSTRRNGFRVLRSIELNLNPKGEGDMDAKVLAELDLVVGSFHSKLRETSDQTERYLAALRNPTVNILGHPVGRIYNHRAGLRADWARVFACAAELDKALEVDAYPDRQDLSVELLLVAKQEGARIAIDTDAHAPEQLRFVELGLAAALLAGIAQDRIINFMSTEQLLAWAKAGRLPITFPGPSS